MVEHKSAASDQGSWRPKIVERDNILEALLSTHIAAKVEILHQHVLWMKEGMTHYDMYDVRGSLTLYVYIYTYWLQSSSLDVTCLENL